MLTYHKFHVSYWQSTSYAPNLQFVTFPSDGGSGLSRLSGTSGVSGSSGSSGSSGVSGVSGASRALWGFWGFWGSLGLSGASGLSGRHPPTIKAVMFHNMAALTMMQSMTIWKSHWRWQAVSQHQDHLPHHSGIMIMPRKLLIAIKE